MSRLAPLLTWRSAVASAHGPDSPTTRLVLLTLSLHMNEKGGSCFPSIVTLAGEARLTEKAVRTHLARAVRGGWINRVRHGYGDRRYWRYEYEAAVPAGVAAEMRNVIPVVVEDAVPGSASPEMGCGTSFHGMGNDVPTISSSNSPVEATAPAREPVAAASLDDEAEYPNPQAELERRGVSTAQAEVAATRYAAEADRVLALCRRFDRENAGLLAQGKNPRGPGWLIAGLRDGYPTDVTVAPPPPNPARGVDAGAYERQVEAARRRAPKNPEALAEAAAFIGKTTPGRKHHNPTPP